MNKEAIIHAAAAVIELERREDYSDLHRQGLQQFDEAGGFSGYSAGGMSMYRHADGGDTDDRDLAIKSWAKLANPNTHTYTVGNILSDGCGSMSYPRPLIRDDGKQCGTVDEVEGPANFTPLAWDAVQETYKGRYGAYLES